MSSAHPVLVEAWRGSAVESTHRGSLVVCDAQGRMLVVCGDAKRATFPRSAIKLLQALPLVASGAADHFGLGDQALALACASHNGEDMHTRTAAEVLAKAGLDHHALGCGVHAPYLPAAHAALAARGEAPCALHNNCSGKHAGFLALGAFRAVAAGADATTTRASLAGYVEHDHPVMREVTAAIETATSFDLSKAVRATDGCSIPTYALPLHAIAHAYARVATGRDMPDGWGAASARLRRAVSQAPECVAGTDRFDTLVMKRLGERVCCKVGAEGVYAAALPERGLGVALKIDDGNTARAAEVVMAAVIETFVTLDADERAFVRGRSDLLMRNWNGREVGRLCASPGLRAVLQQPVGA